MRLLHLEIYIYIYIKYPSPYREIIHHLLVVEHADCARARRAKVEPAARTRKRHRTRQGPGDLSAGPSLLANHHPIPSGERHEDADLVVAAQAQKQTRFKLEALLILF